jgi:iron-sulfur cluster assembly accessory protein
MKNIINVTRSAWIKMENIMHKSKNKIGFIFGVTSGGCNGFNFDLKVIDEENLKEFNRLKPSKLEYKNVTLYIDPLSEMHLIGTTIDYIHEDYSKGIYENKFNYIVDQKLASSCGCGVSFMPKTFK